MQNKEHIFPVRFDQLIQYDYILDRTYADLAAGKTSNSLNSPAIVSYVPFLDKYQIIDGNHRTLQKYFNGDPTVDVTVSEIFPEISKPEDLSLFPYSVISDYEFKMETGGKVYGKRHSEGGEKFKMKRSGKILELEEGEGVINRNSMNDQNVYKVEGTIEEIASCINEQNGGVKFSESNKPCNIKTVMTDKQKEIRERRDKELEEKNKKWAEGKQKFREVFFVQGNYGSGWDDLTSHDIYGDAKDEKKVYDENETQYAHRVITRKISRADYDSGKYAKGGKTPKIKEISYDRALEMFTQGDKISNFYKIISAPYELSTHDNSTKDTMKWLEQKQKELGERLINATLATATGRMDILTAKDAYEVNNVSEKEYDKFYQSFERADEENEEMEHGGNTSPITKNDLPEIFKNYLNAALWSSDDDNNEPLDKNYTLEDIAKTSLEGLRKGVERFVDDNLADLNKSGLDPMQIGHSLWLTQNGHGAGFFDFDMPEGVEERLSDAADKMRGDQLYVGDDGKIYSSKYASGGKTKAPKKIEDQYKGLTPKQVWSKWNSQQKKHFLYDHKDFISKLLYKNVDIEKFSSKKFDQLPVYIKEAIIFHTSDTQYEEGGKTCDIGELYWPDYYVWIGEHGQLNDASKSFDDQYKNAVAFYNREKKDKNLDEYGYIGVNGTGDKFAIIYMVPGYSENLGLKDFKDAKSYETYMNAVDKYYKNKTFTKGKYEK